MRFRVARMRSVCRDGGILLPIPPGEADVECAGVPGTADCYVAVRFAFFDSVR